jgi:hypothetical protein
MVTVFQVGWVCGAYPEGSDGVAPTLDRIMAMVWDQAIASDHEALVYVTEGIIKAALWFLPFRFMIVLLSGS